MSHQVMKKFVLQLFYNFSHIPTIEHSHSNLQNINVDPILATVDWYDKYASIE